MLIDARVLVGGAIVAGVAGGMIQGTRAETGQLAGVAVVEAPAAAPARQAARAVLEGVGIESGMARARVRDAVDVLGALVASKSHPDALRLAFQAYYKYREANPGEVRKPYLYFVDYGLDNTTPRGYVFDMDALKVVDGPFMVSHGSGSASRGSGIPTRFSNAQGSNATSLGLYRAEEIYSFRGKSAGRAYSSPGLRLTGVSGEYNSAARSRGVVVHGAPYVTATRAGRSQGCPAVEMDLAKKLIPQIANGGMVFLFSPLDETWMARDRWAGLDGGSRGRVAG